MTKMNPSLIISSGLQSVGSWRISDDAPQIPNDSDILSVFYGTTVLSFDLQLSFGNDRSQEACNLLLFAYCPIVRTRSGVPSDMSLCHLF